MNDPKSIEIIKKYNVPIILMHMPGNPQTMMKINIKMLYLMFTIFLKKELNIGELKGIKKKNLIIDQGLVLGKILIKMLKY